MDRETKKLIMKMNVVSVGIGRKIVDGVDTGRRAIVVGVTRKVALSELAPRDIIPKRIKGKETDVVTVGEIKALSGDITMQTIDRKGRMRPAPGGVSIGHKSISAGTLGCWVRKEDRFNLGWFILSNNHCLANVNEAEIGDSILQPGPADGGAESHDTIGALSEFVEIKLSGESGCSIARAVVSILNFFAKILGSSTRLAPYELGENLVDCALAEPDTVDDVDRVILECGVPDGYIEPALGMLVKKSGRTTGLSFGEVTQIGATVNVNMGDGKYAYFVDQFIVSGEFSQPGDSGSVILDGDNRAVGLLFAGGNGVTVGNRFSNVLKALKITL